MHLDTHAILLSPACFTQSMFVAVLVVDVVDVALLFEVVL